MKNDKILAFNSMLLTHFLHDEISESLRYQLKVLEEIPQDKMVRWESVGNVWFNLYEAWKTKNDNQISIGTKWLELHVKPNYPLIYDLIMLDVFG